MILHLHKNQVFESSCGTLKCRSEKVMMQQDLFLLATHVSGCECRSNRPTIIYTLPKKKKKWRQKECVFVAKQKEKCNEELFQKIKIHFSILWLFLKHFSCLGYSHILLSSWSLFLHFPTLLLISIFMLIGHIAQKKKKKLKLFFTLSYYTECDKVALLV